MNSQLKNTHGNGARREPPSGRAGHEKRNGAVTRLVVTLAVALMGGSLRGSTPDELPLWPKDVPGAKGTAPQDIPTVTPFLPDADKATGAAIVIFPGGGYGGLADYEGKGYAEWFNQQGIAGFVVKYRLGSAGYRHPVMLWDAARALRLVRARSADWKIDAHRIGVIGSSAGGHLASTILTHFDSGKSDAEDPVERQSSRPDLGILCYPVITMGTNTHWGSRQNLLGPDPSPELIDYLSSEKQVTPQTPPCFIWHTWEDPVVKVENSLDFAIALRKAGVHFDLHIYEKGGHGLALGLKQHHPWTNDLLFWLKAQGFLK